MFPFWSSRAWPSQQAPTDGAWNQMMQTSQMTTPMMPSPQAQFCGPDPMTSQSQAQIQNALNQQNALLHQNIQAQYMTHLHHLQQLQANQSSPRSPGPQPSPTIPAQSNPPEPSMTSRPTPSPTPSQPPATGTQETSQRSPDTQGLVEQVTKTIQAGFQAVVDSNAERNHPQPSATVNSPQATMPTPSREEGPPAACPTPLHGAPSPHQSFSVPGAIPINQPSGGLPFTGHPASGFQSQGLTIPIPHPRPPPFHPSQHLPRRPMATFKGTPASSYQKHHREGTRSPSRDKSPRHSDKRAVSLPEVHAETHSHVDDAAPGRTLPAPGTNR